ncbi:MAG: MBOAT family protein [Cyanobacteria bacterium SBLK]|nr:MBOAT family protein [Cyanobacteria bacterium SBLK]
MNFLDPLYGLFLFIFVWIYWYCGRFRPVVKLDFSQNESGSRLSDDLPSESTQNIRLWILCGASLLFYGFLQIEYIPLLLLMTFLNFQLGKAMETRSRGCFQPKYSRLSDREWEQMQQVWSSRATQLLIFGIGLNVILLLGFKYLPFLLETIAVVLDFPVANQSANWIGDRLIAPLGISFFTFECIAYLVDIYRGAPATRDFLKFSGYKLFFPKLISGPITRFHHFINQFQEIKYPSPEQFSEGAWSIACGAVKKALIADRLGIYVDLCFGNLERAGSGDLWLATLAYGLQLYFDFSGYVDIVRGSAMFLGFNLPENFDFPYFTTSIASFWRRWHMTLGDWLRNYLYFPLGGSRKSLQRTCFNLFIIMLIAGIWHGAAWGFILWGGLHGFALVIHRLIEVQSKRNRTLETWWTTIPGTISAWLTTQIFVFLAWIFFRLPNIQDALFVFNHFFGRMGDVQFTQKVYYDVLGMGRSDLILLIAILVVNMAIAYFIQRGLRLQLNWNLKLILVPLCFLIVWILAPEGGLRYIYFDF